MYMYFEGFLTELVGIYVPRFDTIATTKKKQRNSTRSTFWAHLVAHKREEARLGTERDSAYETQN